MKTRILFVDDDLGIRETLPAVLRLRGYEVAIAATVTEALADLRLHDCQVLISDLNIEAPADGFRVVNAMRAAQPNCINFILTGYPALETAEQAISSDVDAYLSKPADVEELLLAIEERLQKYRERVESGGAGPVH